MRLFIAEAIRRVSSMAGAIEGYEHPDLVEEIFRKTVSFEPNEAWPEMANVSTVLDFGGACGQHYKQARLSAPDVRWAVVETPAMVARASELSTPNLRFFTSIAGAKEWLGDIDLVYSSGALQYTSDPENKITELCATSARRISWERLILSPSGTKSEKQLSLLGENGPGLMHHFRGKAVKFNRILIPIDRFIVAHGKYRLIDRGSDWFKFVR